MAAEWMGWENVFHCEWNEFGQKILKYYWPNAISYGDITKTDFSIHRGSVDIITGGFPCQPYSLAGKRKGKEDERHLWPEMLRAIREIQPGWVVGENVPGIINWSGGMVFHEVQLDLETEGYEVLPIILPACAINAPHKRERTWFIAHADGSRLEGTIQAHKNVSKTNTETSEKTYTLLHIEQLQLCEINRDLCFNDDIPNGLDVKTFSKWWTESIKAYGNAIVPRVVFQIFKAIEQYEINR